MFHGSGEVSISLYLLTQIRLKWKHSNFIILVTGSPWLSVFSYKHNKHVYCMHKNGRQCQQWEGSSIFYVYKKKKNSTLRETITELLIFASKFT